MIPVFNGGRKFRGCLSAVLAASPAADEVIVVGDGEDEETLRWASDQGATVINLPENRGPSVARNSGVNAARSEVIFFVDADVIVPPDCVARVAAFFRQHPQVSAVMGSYDDNPSEPNFLSQYKNLFHHYIHQTARKNATTFWSGYSAIRRDVLVAVGGFDERRRWFEDVELGFRLHRLGHSMRVDPTLQATHQKLWQWCSLVRSDVLHRAVPWTELIHTYRRFPNDLNLRHGSRISVVAAGCLSVGAATAWWWPPGGPMAALAALSLLLLNARLYAFFRRKRGTTFALRAIPCHWLYCLYSGLGFAIGSLTWLCRGELRRFRPGSELTEAGVRTGESADAG